MGDRLEHNAGGSVQQTYVWHLCRICTLLLNCFSTLNIQTVFSKWILFSSQPLFRFMNNYMTNWTELLNIERTCPGLIFYSKKHIFTVCLMRHETWALSAGAAACMHLITAWTWKTSSLHSLLHSSSEKSCPLSRFVSPAAAGLCYYSNCVPHYLLVWPNSCCLKWGVKYIQRNCILSFFFYRCESTVHAACSCTSRLIKSTWEQVGNTVNSFRARDWGTKVSSGFCLPDTAKRL